MKAEIVANIIIDKMNKYNEDRPVQEQTFITINRVQRLLYIIEAAWINRKENKDKTPLFDEEWETWPKGPVIPAVWDAFSTTAVDTYKAKQPVEKVSKQLTRLIDMVLEQTREIDTLDLEKLVKYNSAWDEYYDPDHLALRVSPCLDRLPTIPKSTIDPVVVDMTQIKYYQEDKIEI